MRLFLALLGFSAFAAAGPLPTFSNTTLKAGTGPSVPANITLTIDPVATWNKLKAIYNRLNQTEYTAISNANGDFENWLQDTIESSGLDARSPDSMPANNTLDPEDIEALTTLKAIYDSYNGTDHNTTLKVKRGFGHWLKMAFEAPGLKARSLDSDSTPENASDSLAALTKLKTVYDSLNEKRTGGGLKKKRGFGHWLKMAFEAPGLKARSLDSDSASDDGSDPLTALTKMQAVSDSLNVKRMEGGLKEKRDFVSWVRRTFFGRGPQE